MRNHTVSAVSRYATPLMISAMYTAVCGDTASISAPAPVRMLNSPAAVITATP